MKKLKYILLASVIVLSGCSTATKSQNTESMEETTPSVTAEAKVATEEVAMKEEAMAADAKIMPPSNIRKQIKVNKPEMKLEDIIVKMKDILEIGDGFDEVGSSEYTDENGLKNYNINYTNTVTSDSAWLSTDSYGNIYNYGYSYGNMDRQSIPISREAAVDKAKSVLVKLYGEQASEWETIRQYYYNNLDSYSYNFTFQRAYEGIPVTSDRVDVEVNKYSGKITSMYVTTGTNYDFSDNSYLDSKADVKDIEEAFDKYKLENKLYKAFLGTVDYKAKTMFKNFEYIDVYTQFGGQISIDAKTLEPKVIEENFMMYGGMAEAATDAKLTDAEQEMIDEIEAQTTVAEAEKRARELFNLDSTYKLTWSNFGNYMNVKDLYKWDLSFSNDNYMVSVGMMGKDLELANYSKTNLTSQTEVVGVTPEDAKAIAEAFLTEKAGMVMADLELSPRSKFQQYSGGFVLNYMRAMGDDEYVSTSTVDINISSDGKEVSNFYKNWDYHFEERDFKSKISVDEAYQVLRDSYGFNMVYKRDLEDGGEKPVKLYYEVTVPPHVGFSGNTLTVDANTAKIIDANGAPVQMYSDITYSDLNESKYQEQIKELAENGVGFPNGKLNPKEEVKQIDFLRLMYSMLNIGANPFDLPDEDIYDNLKWTNIMGDDTREPEKIVTNTDVAKYTLRSLSLQNIADRNHIFDDKYTDLSKDNGDYGYLVLAKDMGFIESASDTTLEPNKKIDRETALYYLYNYVKGKQQ